MRLREFKYMNPPARPATKAAAKTDKEKFADLVDNIIKHKPEYTTDSYVNRLDDSGFEYEEHRALGDIAVDYDIGVEVSLGKNDLFTIHIDKDGKRIENIVAKGWEECLRQLGGYFNVPKSGSPAYDSLVESALNEWKYINNSKATQPVSKKAIYEWLLAQIDYDNICSYVVNELTDTVFDITANTAHRKRHNIRVEFIPSSNDYSLKVNSRSFENNTYEEILDFFVAAGTIEVASAIDMLNASSITEAFELYEKLWD